VVEVVEGVGRIGYAMVMVGDDGGCFGMAEVVEGCDCVVDMVERG
jgi:hypothetical protein